MTNSSNGDITHGRAIRHTHPFWFKVCLLDSLPDMPRGASRGCRLLPSVGESVAALEGQLQSLQTAQRNLARQRKSLWMACKRANESSRKAHYTEKTRYVALILASQGTLGSDAAIAYLASKTTVQPNTKTLDVEGLRLTLTIWLDAGNNSWVDSVREKKPATAAKWDIFAKNILENMKLQSGCIPKT